MATQSDRLTLGKLVSIETLGVCGIAFAFSDFAPQGNCGVGLRRSKHDRIMRKQAKATYVFSEGIHILRGNTQIACHEQHMIGRGDGRRL
jgi:hypothetical protein